MKNIFLPVIIALIVLTVSAQTNTLPVKEWSSFSQTPFVLYISGDGGLNDFSTDLCAAINKAGYNIAAVSAKSYFWDKKTPEQTATDITAYVQAISKKEKPAVGSGWLFFRV